MTPLLHGPPSRQSSKVDTQAYNTSRILFHLTSFHPSHSILHPSSPSTLGQNREPQHNLRTSHSNTHQNQHDNNPRDARHLHIRNAIRQDLGQIKEDAAALVEDLDPGPDLEVLADGGVEGVEGWLGVPEEIGGV